MASKRRTIRETLDLLNVHDLSAVQLLEEVLLRVQASDEAVQAWLDIRPRFLMDTAIAHDRRRMNPRPTTALYSIPIGVKDIVDIAGFQSVCGMTSREDIEPAPIDADVVHNLRQTGVTYLGKTTTQEAAAGVISDPCRNPWNTNHIPGGSSGGSAAAVANGTCLGAIGTDTGGSIRIPAALCGVVGLKPTYGSLPLKGIFPLSPSLDTAGPLAGSVADAMALWRGMAGDRSLDAVWERYGDESVGADGKRIGVIRPYFTDRLQQGVGEAFERSIATMKSLGAEIVEVEWSDAAAARTVASVISRIETGQVHHELLREDPDLMGEALRIRAEVGSILPADVWFRCVAAREQAKRSIATIFRNERLDAVLVPTTPASAPRADTDVVTYQDGSTEETGFALTRLTQPWNATGQPVFAMPAGFDAQRLPVGVSFVGRPGGEWELADIAHAFARATGYGEELAPLDA